MFQFLNVCLNFVSGGLLTYFWLIPQTEQHSPFAVPSGEYSCYLQLIFQSALWATATMLDSVLPVYSVIQESMEQTPRQHFDSAWPEELHCFSNSYHLNHIPKGAHSLMNNFCDACPTPLKCHYHLIITKVYLATLFLWGGPKTIFIVWSAAWFLPCLLYPGRPAQMQGHYQWLFVDLQVLDIISLSPRLPHTRIVVIISKDQNKKVTFWMLFNQLCVQCSECMAVTTC